ncbi:MAG: SRPBCC domain-containing protein [Tetrasphaera sp.]
MSTAAIRTHSLARARHLGAPSHRPILAKRTFSALTFVLAPPNAVWFALTDPAATARYWNHAIRSSWQPGERWDHLRTDGSGVADAGGIVLALERPRHLDFTFGPSRVPAYEGASRVHVTLTPTRTMTRIDLRHEGLRDEREFERAALGWSAMLAGLKTYLEVGRPLPRELWEITPSRRG